MPNVTSKNNDPTDPIPIGSAEFLHTPFQIAVTDTNPAGTPETLTITLAGAAPGTLNDSVAGTFTGNTFTAAATADGVTLQQILDGLTYTAATVPDGTVNPVTATITEKDASGTTPPLTININEIGSPKINNVGPTTQLASSPDRLFPFVNVIDPDGGQVTALLTIKDNGLLTDADGTFSSGSGLSPVAGENGTFIIGPTSVAMLNTILQGLVFQPSAVAVGQSVTDMIGLTVTDSLTGLPASATATVISQGPPAPNTAPVISHTQSNQQTAVNTPILPFNGATISDNNPNPKDSATLVITGGGTLSGTDLVASATSGTYTIAAETPAQLMSDIDGLTFGPPALASGQSSATSSVALTVTNVGNGLADTDDNTKIVEGTPPPSDNPSGNKGQGTSDPTINTTPVTNPDVVSITAASLNIAVTNPDIGEAYRLYQAALDRVPDQGGLTFWTDQLLNGSTPLALANGFVNSPEFLADYGGLSNSDFVNTLYNNVLHRPADPSGEAYWVNVLNAGISRPAVLLSFSDSVENRADTAVATHT